jgi:serine/threonine-protein kinase
VSISVFASLFAGVFTSGAAAQSSSDDKAAAQALFDQGLSHLREGKLEQACGELERSQALERGIGTMLYLAECYEKLGRNASAWALFREAASVAAAQGETERARVGDSRADRLEPTLPRLTLQVAPENHIDGFELLRNGQPVRAPSWGVAVPVDAGQHVLSARAPGKLAWTQTVTVHGNGERLEVQVPALAVDPAAPLMMTAAPPGGSDAVAAPGALAPSAVPAGAPAGGSAAGAGSGPAAPAAPPASVAFSTEHDTWPLQRTIALVVGGSGVLALGIGGYFGLRAFDKNDEAEQYCPANLGGTRCSDERAETLTSDAEDAATLSSVFMIGGAVLAVAGVVLYVTAPDEHSPTLALRAAPGEVRATVGGAF